MRKLKTGQKRPKTQKSRPKTATKARKPKKPKSRQKRKSARPTKSKSQRTKKNRPPTPPKTPQTRANAKGKSQTPPKPPKPPKRVVLTLGRPAYAKQRSQSQKGPKKAPKLPKKRQNHQKAPKSNTSPKSHSGGQNRPKSSTPPRPKRAKTAMWLFPRRILIALFESRRVLKWPKCVVFRQNVHTRWYMPKSLHQTVKKSRGYVQNMQNIRKIIENSCCRTVQTYAKLDAKVMVCQNVEKLKPWSDLNPDNCFAHASWQDWPILTRKCVQKWVFDRFETSKSENSWDPWDNP